MRALLLCLICAIGLSSGPAAAERIKDLASVAGVRGNALVGYGLVVGLDGSGDQTSQAPFTVQSLKVMLEQLGVALPAGVQPQLKNVAAVALHAELPAFAKPGQRMDVTVSSIGNASSLRGGSLIMSPLRAADGRVYAIAQGNVVVGGLGVAAKDGSRLSINIPSAGRIPGGATIERAPPDDFSSTARLQLNLHVPDFTSAARMAQAINDRFGVGTAEPMDAVSVGVLAPPTTGARVAFLSELENIELQAAAAPARVIVNSRTGTVVIGAQVRVLPAAVSHGSLSVSIREDAGVSQPAPFSSGQTVVVPDSGIEVSQQGGRMFLFPAGVSLDEIVRAINRVGAAPGDLVAILEALREAGALRAELVVI